MNRGLNHSCRLSALWHALQRQTGWHALKGRGAGVWHASKGQTGWHALKGRGAAETAPPPGNHALSGRATHAHHRRAARGAVLLIALVCVAVASIVLVGLARLAVAERDRERAEYWSIQAAWLVESGLQRAAARLGLDPSYQGETWSIPAEALESHDRAVVRIAVQTPSGQSAERLIRAQADYPDDPVHRARRTREITVTLALPKGTAPFSRTSPRKSGQSP